MPAAPYARVSSDRQDVDLSVAEKLRASRDYAEKNGYVVKAALGLVDDRPEFSRMLDEASEPKAPFSEVLMGGRIGSIQARSDC